MQGHDPQIAGSHQAGAFYVILLLAPGEFRPHHPGKAGNEQNAQDQNDVVGPALCQAQNHQGQQDAGKGGEGIAKSGEDGIRDTAIIAAQPANEEAKHTANGHYGQGHQKGGSGAAQYTAENITAKIIRAHEMMPRRRLGLGGGVHLGGSVGGPHQANQN